MARIAENPPRKVCVILGAGASYDVRSAGSPVVNEGLRPPLARDLFNLDRHGEFRSILAQYEGAVVLAQNLAARSSLGDFDLEKELKRIAEHPDDQVREHYKHVPPYLRDLLMMCSYGYTSYPSCYIQLVQALLAEEHSDVLFLALNYDDMLEQALYRFTSGALRFESLDDYVRTSQPAKVVKLHGSINWFTPIGPQNTDWMTQVRNNDVLAKPSEGDIHVKTSHGRSDQLRTYQIEIAGQHAYPVLTAPLAGKGAAAMVCPAMHLETACEFLTDCSRFLVIGSSGIDEDLLALLDQSVAPKSPWVQFVSGRSDIGEGVRQRFVSRVRAFRSISSLDGAVVFNGGFASYVASDALLKFLRTSLD